MKKVTLLALVVLSLIAHNATQAQIHLSGSLNGFLADTTYIVDSLIYVDSTAALIIAPGAEFQFNGLYNFIIYGYLRAEGTQLDSIHFKLASGVLAWGSIIFRIGSADSSMLSYCVITGASGSAINTYQTDLDISNCTIAHNYANWGGGIYCSSASPTIHNCIVTDNHAQKNGGGIYCTGSNPYIEECIITNNSCNNDTFAFASGRGGGGLCANHSSNPTINSGWFFNNLSHHNGGGISINDNSHPILADCIFASNSADTSGGGIFCSSYCHPNIYGCIIDSNSCNYHGGGIDLLDNVTATINDCLIRFNSADSTGGGIASYLSNSIISYAEFQQNSAGVYGGGVGYTFTMADLNYCLIYGNEAPQGGGLAFWDSDSGIIRNCTIYGNTAQGDGGGCYLHNSSPIFDNLIMSESHGNGGIYFSNAIDTDVNFSNFYNNQSGNFTGPAVGLPPGLGLLNAINVNNDSCDIYQNVFLDPQFVDPIHGNYQLTVLSPCIDSGDPQTPLDPDSTVADMGAFYFDQSFLPATIVMTPFNPPIIIPQNGGSFGYNVLFHNLETYPVNLDFWIMLKLPNGNWWGPVFGPINRTLPGGSSPNRDRTQTVPANAPAGVYLYDGRIGRYPNEIWDHSHFYFRKAGFRISEGTTSWQDSGFGEWTNTGEDFDRGTCSVMSPLDATKRVPPNVTPNPFNPTTVISYELRAASFVSLNIYDTTGRLETTLVNGWRDAGEQQVTFDGSTLASGVYLYRLEAGTWTETGKMILLK